MVILSSYSSLYGHYAASLLSANQGSLEPGLDYDVIGHWGLVLLLCRHRVDEVGITGETPGAIEQ